MGEWEEILRFRIQAYEERKREYLRWTATGLTAIAVLIGITLQSIGPVRFGSHFYLSLGTLFLGSYLTGTLIWQLAREKIQQAVGSITGTGRPARPWDLVVTPSDAGRIPPAKIASDLSVSLLVTILVALSAWEFATPASGPLSELAEFRIGTIVIFALMLVGVRSAKKSPPSPGGGTYIVMKALIVGYYSFQLWLVAHAFLAITTLGLQAPSMILIVLEGAGLLSIGRVIWWIAWPMVKGNGEVMGALSRIQDGIMSGKYSTPEEVSSDVKEVYTRRGDESNRRPGVS